MTATPASNIIPFAFEDRLIRVYKPNGEPWFVGKDVCEVLEISKHNQALDRLDDDERGTYSVGTPGGEQTMVIISEAGVFRLIFTSRKPQAEVFKRWLAHEVLPALRKHGRYALPGQAGPAETPIEEGAIGGEPVAVVTQKLSMVRESRLIHGIERARLLWDRLGLPQVPGGNEPAIADARACLRALLDQSVVEHEGPTTPFTIEHAILSSLEDSGYFDMRLRELGIRVLPERDGFIVSNRFGTTHRGMVADQKINRILIHLPGAQRMGPTKFDGSTHRGVFIPASALDDLRGVTAH